MKNLILMILIYTLLGLSVPLSSYAKDFNLSINSTKTNIKKSLGEPKYLTTDELGYDTWIYEYNDNYPIKQMYGINYTENSKKKNKIEKLNPELTLILKFDTNDTLRSYAYYTKQN